MRLFSAQGLKQLENALGLADANLPITSIVITASAKEVMTASVNIVLDVDQQGEVMKVVRDYVMVPKDGRTLREDR